MTLAPPVIMKTIKLSVCDCGESALHDKIILGTEYIIYPETRGESTCTWICGKCKKEYRKVEMVMASSIIDKTYIGWLPSQLFFKES